MSLEIKLLEFKLSAEKRVGVWQHKLLIPFVSYVQSLRSWQEREWKRTEKDWWTIFDQYCEQQPSTRRKSK